MSLYTPGRRRAIVLLLLTSILVLTLDLRGNELFDAARRGFHTVLEPLESAAEVVSRPVEDAWYGITRYGEVEDENRELREQLDAAQAEQVMAQALIVENQELRALNDLDSLADHPTVTATVVGQSPTNLDQVIEINRGEDDGIQVGMAVMSTAGLVGKVTSVEPGRAQVMLLTDSRYAVDVKIVPPAPPPPPPTTTTTTTTTTPSTTTTVPPVPTVAPVVPAGAGETTTTSSSAVDTTTSTVAPPPTTVEATTTTVDVDQVRETGAFEGQGDDQLPRVTFLDTTPALGRFQVGDLVYTSGSRDSLAPENIPVGRVLNVIERTSSEGPLLEVETFADVDRLYFVRVVLYEPELEASADGGTDD